MTDDIRAFLRDWVRRNAKASGYPPGNPNAPDARDWAHRALVDAASAGWSQQRVEQEIGDVVGFMQAELDRLRPATPPADEPKP
ncbi:hypothetical protein [Marinivivus vitaminiproducens]|uniref:hypothetical protein n=1 Tax=Marinivivus vitaminiproducens TaxID=3035935 RepID=UPI0027A88F85|nr:hypothetical protein P4R82_06690 [Geminicoccaceae bacterium SCSIO 64248]